MTKLLYIEASPRETESGSSQIAPTYLAALRAENPALEVDILTVWDAALPEFDRRRNDKRPIWPDNTAVFDSGGTIMTPSSANKLNLADLPRVVRESFAAMRAEMAVLSDAPAARQQASRA